MPIELIVLAAIVFVLFKWLSKSPVRKGKAGEAKVSAAIKARLPGDSYVLIDDIVLPDERGETQIDHVLVSKFGVFVIETKNYSGWIFGRKNDPTWTQTFRTKRFKFQNPLRQNYRHVKAVQRHTQVPEDWIHSVVLFVGDARFKTSVPANVTSLRKGIRYIQSFSHQVMTDARLARIADSLMTKEPIRSAPPVTQHRALRPVSEVAAPINVSSNQSNTPVVAGVASSWLKILSISLALACGMSFVAIQAFLPGNEAQARQAALVEGEIPEVFSCVEATSGDARPSASEPATPKEPLPPAPIFEMSGQVHKVVSGDTIVVKDETGKKHQIRLHGIDAPERWQKHSSKAKKALRKRLAKQTIEVEAMQAEYDGRIVGVVYVNGENVNLEMVCSGHAWWYERFAPTATELQSCQQQAQQEAMGLWANPDPTPPWEYRDKK